MGTDAAPEVSWAPPHGGQVPSLSLEPSVAVTSELASISRLSPAKLRVRLHFPAPRKLGVAMSHCWVELV